MTTGFNPTVLLTPLEPLAIPASLEIPGVPPPFILPSLVPSALPVGSQARATLFLLNSLPWPVRDVSGIIEVGGQPAGAFEGQTLLPVGIPSVVEVEMAMPDLVGALTVDVTVDWFGASVSRRIGSIQVTEPPGAQLLNIALDAPSPSLEVGETMPLTATGAYSDGGSLNITNLAAWQSSNPQVFNVSPTGVVTGAGEGIASVTASLAGITSPPLDLEVTAAAPVLQQLTIEPLEANLEPGGTLPFSAEGVFDDGSRVDLTADVVWSSSNTDAATISAAGVATAVAEGQTDITASLLGITSQAALLVVQVIEALLESITLDPADDTLEIGQTRQVQATGHYDDGSTSNITTLATWQSSDESVATVSPSGLVTAVAEGTTEISASLEGIVSAVTALIEVLPPEPEFVISDLTVDNPEPAEGDTISFTLSVLNDGLVGGIFQGNTQIVDSEGNVVRPFNADPFSLDIAAGATANFQEQYVTGEPGGYFYEVWTPDQLLRLAALAFNVQAPEFVISSLTISDPEPAEGDEPTFTLSVLNDSPVAGLFEFNRRIVRLDGTALIPFSSGTFSLNIEPGATEAFAEALFLTEAGEFTYEVWDALLAVVLASLPFIVQPPPAPAISITFPETDITVTEGETVGFQGAATSGDGSTDLSPSIGWFRDGAPVGIGAGQNILFPDPGSFIVEARVVDPATGREASASRTITVEALVWEAGDLSLDSISVDNPNPGPGDSVTLTITIGHPTGKDLPVIMDLTLITASGARGTTITTLFNSGTQPTIQVQVGPITIGTDAEEGPYDVEVVLTEDTAIADLLSGIRLMPEEYQIE